MAIQSTFYTGTALETRTFPSTKHIATKQHMAVWRQEVASPFTWVQMDITEYQLITNACVLNTLLSTTLYSDLEVRVADAPDELVSSPSDITIVAGIEAEIVIVAGIADEVVTVADNDANVTLVGDDLALGASSAILNAEANAAQTQADVVLTNADVVLTHADVVLTHADVVLTNADVVSASDSEAAAAASAASIDPTKLLHTIGDGGGDPEGYEATELDKYIKLPVTITPDADSDYTLTAGENLYGRLTLVDGSWTATHNIIVDTSIRELVIDNTSGTYTATIKTSSGSGIPVLAGDTLKLYCDGTNVIRNENRSLLAEIIVTSDLASVEFTGLDILSHKSYRIEFDWISGLTLPIDLFINGDTTATNYWNQELQINGATVTGVKTNTAHIAYSNTNKAKYVIFVQMDALGFVQATSQGITGLGSGSLAENYYWLKVASVTNVTTLKLQSATSGILIDSQIRIYRGDM